MSGRMKLERRSAEAKEQDTSVLEVTTPSLDSPQSFAENKTGNRTLIF